jgi:hypothetical protein
MIELFTRNRIIKPFDCRFKLNGFAIVPEDLHLDRRG